MLLEMAADGSDERVVVGSRRGGMTAPERLAKARRAAALFRGRGVDHVGMIDLNSEAVPIALFGAALAGLPFAPVNYRLTDDKLNDIVARLSPGLVIVGADIVGRLEDHDGIQLITTDDLRAAVDAARAADDELPFVDPEDIAILLFTSGTTGEPKAAVLRHRHLASYIISTVEFLGADADDAQLVSVPSYHVAGVSAVLSSIYSGRRIAYLPGFDAEEWVRTVADEQITQAMVVPTMLGRVLDVMETQGEALPSLRHLSYGGGRMPTELIERAITALPHVDYVNAYGLTETSSTISVLTPDDHREAIGSDDPAVRRRLGSVGRPLPSLESAARSTCAASRWRGSTSDGPCSPRTAGFRPTTPASSTSTASCSLTVGSTTSSCAAPRTSRQERSRTCSPTIGPWPRRRWLEYRTQSGARPWRPRSCSPRAPTFRRPSCRGGCASGCGRPRRPSSSSSARRCPTTRRASCCAVSSARS
jgi:acyl-CoA synthetase (AMP-forming)/AMP-acid ligase II